MNAPLAVRLEGRRLVLAAAGAQLLALPLDEGGRHRIVVADPAAAQRVVAALEAWPGTGILPAGGGLLGACTVAENFALALQYDADPGDLRDWDAEFEIALRLVGLSGARLGSLGRELPLNLERTERWALGLARCLLRPPELLVIDRAFAGLARRQADALLAVEAAYHRRHPFRAALFVDLDSHELPELPDCRTLTELAEAACPC